MTDSSGRVPDAIEPLVGYRAWLYLVSGPATLHPLSGAGWSIGASDWDGASRGWVAASCVADPGHVAAERCSCGFYAMKSLFTLRRSLPSADLFMMDMGKYVVLGRVALAGRMVEHEYGYRAERARIAELMPISGSESSVTRLAALLGLPVGDTIAPPHGWFWLPPNGRSPVRLRVAEWVRDQAA